MILYLEHFFINFSILEDPVAGPAFTKHVPYWFERTGKTEFNSKQVSKTFSGKISVWPIGITDKEEEIINQEKEKL